MVQMIPVENKDAHMLSPVAKIKFQKKLTRKKNCRWYTVENIYFTDAVKVFVLAILYLKKTHIVMLLTKKMHLPLSVSTFAYLGWGLKLAHKWQCQYIAAGSQHRHEREIRTNEIPSWAYDAALFKTNSKQRLSTFTTCAEVIGIRAKNATLSWKNSKNLRTLGRLVSPLPRWTGCSPAAASPGRISSSGTVADTQKDFRGDDAADNLCKGPLHLLSPPAYAPGAFQLFM